MLKLPNELYPFKVDLENNIENTFTILSSYVFRFLKVYILDFSALLHNNHFQIQLVYISLLDYSSYTNADLKISLYVCIRVKIIP